MVKVAAYSSPFYTRKNQNNMSYSGGAVAVASSSVNLYTPVFDRYSKGYERWSLPDQVFRLNPSPLSWIKDKNLLEAVNKLEHVKFDKKDVDYIQSLGVVLPFLSGKSAVDFIKNSHVGVKFDAMPSENIHAVYDYDNNCIKINENYRYTQNPAEILAISEAILHEAGHAENQDGESSIQEELDCLAMGALAHRIYSKNSPNIFNNDNSLIVKDGVCVYADLFFGQDASKSGLILRLKEKYGDLPAGDLNHPPSDLALSIKNC